MNLGIWACEHYFKIYFPVSLFRLEYNLLEAITGQFMLEGTLKILSLPIPEL